MRIAQIAPLFETVPPCRYGGTERVVAGLCNGLVARGHEVTLFAAEGSRTAADLVVVAPAPLRHELSGQHFDGVAPDEHLHMLAEIFGRADDFDIVHAHTDVWTLPFIDLVAIPAIVTLHGRLDIDSAQLILPRYPQVPLVSVSDFQRRPLDHAQLRWMGTAYNGLEIDAYLRAEPVHGDYLAFVGRINADKRPDWAVEVARRAGMPLRVAAKVDPPDVDYWERDIRPLFEANDVDFLGEITEADKPSFFAEAAALLFPIDWPEPFGLVMVESMAAGTPVVALNRGAVREVIDDGVTGFICRDLDEMVCSISRVGDLDPQQIRAGGQRFSSEAMVDTYLEMYKDVLVEWRPTPDTAIRTAQWLTPRTEQTELSIQEATSASVA